MKAAIIVISQVLSAVVFPEWSSKSIFAPQKTNPFPLLGGVPSREGADTKIIWCPLNSGVPKERFHCDAEAVIK